MDSYCRQGGNGCPSDQLPIDYEYRGVEGVPMVVLGQVVSAWYGAEGRTADVTKKLKELLRDNDTVVPSNAVFGDPAPGLVKNLVVRTVPHRLEEQLANLRESLDSAREAAREAGREKLLDFLDSTAAGLHERWALDLESLR